MSNNSASGLIKNKVVPRSKKASHLQTHQLHEDSNDPLEDTLQNTNTNQMRNIQKHQTTIGLQKANFQLAMERKKQMSNRYYKGQQVPYRVDLQHFKIYGPGVYLFFQFLWKFSMLLLVLAIISLVPTIYNYTQGNRFQNSVASLDTYISQISISNFYGNDPKKISSQQISSTKVPKMLNCITDLTCCLLVMIFYFYWTAQSQKKTQDLKKTVKLANYFTLQLTQFSQDTTDHDVYQFFSKFGMVTQVAPVKNFSQTIQLSKEIYENECDIKQLKIQQDQKKEECNKKQIQKTQKKIVKLYKELAKEQTKTKEQTIKYYVSFYTPLQRANTLKRFTKIKSWCGCCTKVPQDYLLKGQKVKVEACHDQPGEILWQNVHITWKTRWMRALAQFLFLLIFVAAGFFLISLLNIATPPSNTDDLDTSSYSSTSILSVTNNTIVQSWCLKDTTTAVSTAALSKICQPYIDRYYVNLVITYSITVLVILIKAILKKLVIFIAKFQRYKEQTEQSIDIVKNLVIIYIITTVIIGFLLQANLFGIQFKNIIPNLLNSQTLKKNAAQITDYSVLQNRWYVDIGYQIWLTWLILAFSPHLYMPLYYYLMEWVNERWAKKEKLQKNMQKALQPIEFQIEDHYANIIMVFIVGFAFSGGIPSMLILSFIGIFTRYIYLKFLFIRFAKVPKTIDQALNDAVLSYFPWALFIHFCMTLWMYSVPSIFAFETSIFSQWYKSTNSTILQFISSILGKLIASYYYTLAAGIMMLAILVKEVIYDFFATVFKKQDDKLEQIQKQDTANDLVGMMRSQRGITSSYKIQNNPNYFEILSIKQKMKERLQKGELKSVEDEKQ